MRTIGVLVLFAAAVCGGTPEGKAALEKGDYKLALQELQAAAEGDALVKKYIKQIRANMKKGLPFEEIAR